MGPLYEKLGLVNPYLEDQAEALEDVGDGIHRLNFELEGWLGIMFGQFDEMMRMLGSFDDEGLFDPSGEIFQMLDRLEQFGVDFAETNIDEQIGAWVLQMQEFIATLDPNSEAYQQASWALAELMLRFQEMGGNLEDIEGSEWTSAFNTGSQTKAMGELNTSLLKLNDTIYLLVEALGGIPEEVANINDELFNTVALYGNIGSKGGGDIGELPKFHTGGVSSDETLAVLKKNEAVISPQVTAMYGASAMNNFARTGNVGALGGGQPIVVSPVVQIHEATPRTWAEITENTIQPNLKNSENFYQTAGNVYASKRN